ncbi:MAG: DUF4236 domain-containing protein [Bacteroidetes bacterium]|nr:DUF4236 domain-containing protein [Bacteroidota bacterium]
MGFYLRKSVRVGPLRFNFSKSGIGASAGIKGLRLGTGPRGNYVHMGRHGLYFRKTLSSKSSTKEPSFHLRESPSSEPVSNYNLPGVEDFREIESADVQQMVDSSSRELLDEINSKQKKFKIFPLMFVLSVVIVLFLLSSKAPTWVIVASLVLILLLLVLAKYRDVMAKSVVIFYDLEDVAKDAYAKFHDAFEKLVACSKSWHIEAEGNVTDPKYHAGASGVVSRKGISLTKGKIPVIKTNIDIPRIPVGKQFLAFMPDRLLIFEPRAVGAISYDDLEIQVDEQPFIEDEHVPRDSQVIEYTWKYVNKKGGPDKRFTDNRQIPVVLYENLYFMSSSGLSEVIQLSKTGIGEQLRATIETLAKVNSDIQERPLDTLSSPSKSYSDDNEELWLKNGIASFKSGKHEQALAAFTEAIGLNSKYILAYFNRGCVHNKLGNREQAINDLKIAATLGHSKSQEILKSKGISWTE